MAKHQVELKIDAKMLRRIFLATQDMVFLNLYDDFSELEKCLNLAGIDTEDDEEFN